MMAEPAPNLAPPGAGIPRIERWIGNIIIKCFTLQSRVDVECLRTEYPRSLNHLIDMAKAFPEEAREKRVLIQRLRGLEDSSRYYSPAMVLEHVALVDSGIAETVKTLGRGEVPSYKVSTADVKPDPEVKWDAALGGLRSASEAFMDSLGSDFSSNARLAHPWFGPLNAWQWAQFTVIHHKIHVRQLQAMLSPNGQ